MNTCSAAAPDWADLPYHRLAHVTPGASRWWRPLAMLGMLVLLTCLAGLLAALAVMGWEHVPGVPQPTEQFDDSRNPSDVLFGYGVIALSLPIVLLTVRWAGGRHGTIHSVTGRFRWASLWSAVAVTLPVFLVFDGLSYRADPPVDLSLPSLRTWAWVALVTVLVVPLQSAAEEYLFRGLIPQLVGTWLRAPWWGPLVATPLFVWGHAYDAWGLVVIAVLALCAAFLTWKSGGLELAVALHATNNVAGTLFAPLSPTSLHQGGTDPLNDVAQLFLTLALTWWLVRDVDRRHHLMRWQPLVRRNDERRI